MRIQYKIVIIVVVLILLSPVLFIVWPRLPVSIGAAAFPEAIFFLKTDQKHIVLTIDDGPDPETSPKLSAMLSDLNVPTTFFVLGERARENDDVIRRLVADGHSIGAHFDADEISALQSDRDLRASLKASLDSIPQTVNVAFVRPGFGIPTPEIAQAIEEVGRTMVVGDIPAFDVLDLPDWVYLWYYRLVIRNGSILTFHDGGARGRKNLARIDMIVRDQRTRGFEFVALRKQARTGDAARDD